MKALTAKFAFVQRESGPHPRCGRLTAVIAAICLSGGMLVTAATAQARTVITPETGTAAQPGAGSATAMPSIVPKPVSMTLGHGQFTLTARTGIVVTPGSAAALPVARDLAGYLRPATGYRLPVVAGPHGGDGSNITVMLGNPGTLHGDSDGEGYQLNVSVGGVTLEAPTLHGLYDGVQTIRQLLPPWIASDAVSPGPWTMPVVRITDYPRYGYRGLMIDIARHYETPQAVEQLINQAAAYKIDVLHLHLSDDQGFRIVINGFPRLTAIGGQGSVGTDGRTMDPGGYWTQAQYKAVVADAAAHFITVVPEVDSPGHNNAIIMSEYDDTANPLLNGHPQDINCSVNNPPQWDYTTDVGYSALCPDSQNTWTIMSAIIKQLTAMSPGPYYDIGGDEVPSTLLSQQQYAGFVNQEAGIVNGDGKTVMGWADIAGPGTDLTGPSVAEYWQPASGSSSSTVTATEAVAKGMKLIMAPANHTYLDQKYLAGSAGNVPSTLGLDWACPTGCDVSAAYNWDPGNLVTGVTDKNVIGVEGAIWGETVVNLSNVDYMVFPRLLALAEVAWSPDAVRTPSSAAYSDFLARLAAQDGRLMAANVNFYPSAEVPWTLELAPSVVRLRAQGQVNGAVATLAAPGIQPGDVTATIDWGDGTTTAGTVTGTAPTATTVNSLYTISGTHSYEHAGVYHATVTASALGKTPVTTQVTIVSLPRQPTGH
jgi:hexosaminidase